MNLQSLMLLVEIIDSGNLSHAARKLEVSRANVSYRLVKLEKELGLQLFRRTTRKVEPTEVGLRLYKHGCAIINEMNAAKDTVTALGDGLVGRVGVSVPSGYGQMVMSEWLIEFKKLYPAIVLDVLFENRTDNLRDGVDIAIRIMREAPASLVARSLGPVRYVVCASTDYASAHGLPRTLEELSRSPIVTTGGGGKYLRLTAYRDNERSDIDLAPTLCSEHFPFLRQGILAGLGVGVVPDYVVHDKIAEGEILLALDSYSFSVFDSHMYILYLPTRHQTRAVRTFIDFLFTKSGEPPRI